MVCQRWVPNVCTDTQVAAVWQPTLLSTYSWTYINGVNYSAGVQLSTLAAPPVALTHTGVSQLSCAGTMVRIQFVCDSASLRPYIASSYKGVSANYACVFTFVVPTYLVCTAPGQPSLTAPATTVSGCTPTINGTTYNLAPLGAYDISAYDANSVQYVYRPCGVVANAFGQSTRSTSLSQLIAIPVVCTQPSPTVNLTSIAGAYSSSTSTWSALPNNQGVQLSQSTGQNCTASCGGSVVYSGPWQSIVQFVCTANAQNISTSASASIGSYNAQCQPVGGGACTLTFTTQTTNACQPGQNGNTDGSGSDSSDSGLSGGQIAGIVVGSVVGGLLLLGCLLFLCVSMTRGSGSGKSSQPINTTTYQNQTDASRVGSSAEASINRSTAVELA